MPIDPFIQQVMERRRIAAAEQGKFKEPDSVLEWALRYRRPDGNPFSLERYEPLRAIYEDDHPRLVIMKPAQRGVSEYAVNLACFALEYGARRWVHGKSKAGLNVGYIFPVRGALMEFSKERVSSLKDESPHLSTLFGGDEFDALGFKQVGKSYFYLRGGTSTSDLLSFAADVMILDEYDRLDKKAVALARRRMNASLVKREIDISTPTLPGHGISAAYLASDQRIYETPCPHCGAWNTYDFFRDVYLDDVPYEDSNDQTGWKSWSQEKGDLANIELRCPTCHGAISSDARCAQGRWRATAPEYTRVHGYHIPWWAFPFIDLADFVHSALSEEIEEIEELYRSDLGLPYGAGGGQVTEEMLRQLTVAMPETGLPRNGWRNNTLGADIGARVHYRVSGIGPDGMRYVREIGATDWDGLDHLMVRYQIRMAVVDAEPEYSLSEAFCKKWKGRAKRAFYPTTANALRGTLMNVKKDPNDKKDTHDLQLNRTMAMDTVYKTIADAKEIWPNFIVNNPEVIEHLTAPSRIRSEDANGQPHYTWVHTRPDHLFHACLVAGTLISTDHGDIPIENVTPGMRVWTRSGWRCVTYAGQTNDNAEVWEYLFTNGAVLRATANHPVYTVERGFVPLHSTVYSDTMVSWSGSSRSSIAESCSEDTRTANGALIGSISRQAVSTVSKASSGFIRRSGRTRTGRFLRDAISTIVTRIRSTMIYPTCSASSGSSICHSITRATHLAKSTWIGSDPWRTHGIGQQRVAGGIAVTPVERLYVERLKERVWHAAVRLLVRPILTTIHRAAPGHAALLFAAGSVLTTWIVCAASAVGRSASIGTERRRRAPAPAERYARVRPSGRKPAGTAAVFNLSVDDAEEYFANGILVHNCVYDMMAERVMPKSGTFTAAVRGARPMVTAYQQGVGQRSAMPAPSISRHGRLPLNDERGPRHIHGL